MKTQYGFAVALVGGLMALALIGLRVNANMLVWVFGTLGAVAMLSIATKSLVIDMNKKEIRSKTALLRPPTTIQLADLQEFELLTIRQGFFITNTSLNAVYLKKGKEKAVPIAQGFTVRAMQNILNEIEEIIHEDEFER